ncbi:MAG: hypothetical protein EAZ42_02165 [Verrucomicrobia bacterium]|nr:MAG: hypothetical protein EAZ42_02165 [Verrucomicrobiota bacterium]
MIRYLFPMIAVVCASCQSIGQTTEAKAEYVSEAPLPKGWPVPGPYNQVALKSYPSYRAAFSEQQGSTRSFWRLFQHIKANDIPMTAPVQMGVNTQDEKVERTSMAFLYQNTQVGKTGQAEEKVNVRDIPAEKALSYAWQGTDSNENLTAAYQSLKAELATRKMHAREFRLLGYNGPGTPRKKATWELQALLK